MKVAAILSVLTSFFAMECGDGSLKGTQGSSQCFMTGMQVLPKTATVDHTAIAPANSQHFDAFQSSAPPGCGFALGNLLTATWTVSDPANATISNVRDATYGTATCLNAAPAPITVTATASSGNGSTVTATATLTCN